MGWNTSLVLIEHGGVGDISRLGKERWISSETDSVSAGTFETASSQKLPENHPAVARIGDWFAVFTTNVDLFMDQDLWTSLSRKRRILSLYMCSVSTFYALGIYSNSKLRRDLRFIDRKKAMDKGTPLAVEVRIPIPSWGPDESYLFAVMEAFTGIAFEDLESANYDMHRLVYTPAGI